MVRLSTVYYMAYKEIGFVQSLSKSLLSSAKINNQTEDVASTPTRNSSQEKTFNITFIH